MSNVSPELYILLGERRGGEQKAAAAGSHLKSLDQAEETNTWAWEEM